MIDYIKQILNINNYSQSKDNEVLFTWKWEYFLLSEYNTTEIELFFESKKTSDIVKKFKQEKGKISDIEKNTSLIILLKVILNSY